MSSSSSSSESGRNLIEWNLCTLLSLADNTQPLRAPQTALLRDDVVETLRTRSTKLGSGSFGYALSVQRSDVSGVFTVPGVETDQNRVVVKVSNVRRSTATLSVDSYDEQFLREAAIGMAIELRRRSSPPLSPALRQALEPLAAVHLFKMWPGGTDINSAASREAMALRVQSLRLAELDHQHRDDDTYRVPDEAPVINDSDGAALNARETQLLAFYNNTLRKPDYAQLDREGADYTTLLPAEAARQQRTRVLKDVGRENALQNAIAAIPTTQSPRERHRAEAQRVRDLYYYFARAGEFLPVQPRVVYGPVLAVSQPFVDGESMWWWLRSQHGLYARAFDPPGKAVFERRMVITLRALQVLLERLNASAGVYHRDLNTANVIMRRLPLRHRALQLEGVYGSMRFYDNAQKDWRHLQPHEWPPADQGFDTVLVPHLIDFGRAALTDPDQALFGAPSNRARRYTVDGRVAPGIDLQTVALSVAYALNERLERPPKVREFVAAAFTWSDAQLRLLDNNRWRQLHVDGRVFDFHSAKSKVLEKYAVQCAQLVRWALHEPLEELALDQKQRSPLDYLRYDQPIWCLQLHQLAQSRQVHGVDYMQHGAPGWRCLSL